MEIWQQTGLVTVLCVAVVLALAEAARRLIPPLGRLGLPSSIVAGVLGLLLGPQVVGWLPLSRELLESAVYHGLAVVFIAVALQPSSASSEDGSSDSRSAVSMMFAIVLMVTAQTALGIGFVYVLHLAGGPTHPGLGLLLALGFEQGPGQAMAMGGAWEPALQDGRQLGLIIAAAGFAWSVVVGVPLVLVGKRRGWVSPAQTDEPGALLGASGLEEPGSLDALTRHGVIVALCYLATLGVCTVLSLLIAVVAPDVAKMVWGFHFIVGAMVATGVRLGLSRLPGPALLDASLLSRIGGTAVDVTTVCALAAVQLAVLSANWVPIAVLTTLGGALTLMICLWLAPRAFPTAPFEHAVVWFGMSTGTLPMGLALLRIIDPQLKSSAPLSAVAGSAGATLGAIPVVLILHPLVVVSWPDDTAWALPLWLCVAVAYACGVLVIWRITGLLRLWGPVSWTPAKGPASVGVTDDNGPIP